MTGLLRPAGLIALLMLAGCVAPPPGANPPGTQAYLSTHCAAGLYQCELAAAGTAGQPCACPGLGAPSYGVIR